MFDLVNIFSIASQVNVLHCCFIGRLIHTLFSRTRLRIQYKWKDVKLLLTGRSWETEKLLRQDEHCQVTTRDQCVISIILMLNSHHSILQATGKNINSIPAEIAVLLPQLAYLLTSRLINWGNCVARYHHHRMGGELQQHSLMNFPKWYANVKIHEAIFLSCSTVIVLKIYWKVVKFALFTLFWQFYQNISVKDHVSPPETDSYLLVS